MFLQFLGVIGVILGAVSIVRGCIGGSTTNDEELRERLLEEEEMLFSSGISSV